MELPHFDSSPVQVSQCAGSSRGEGALFSLKGRAGCGGVGKRWRRFCMQGRQERTPNSVCIRKKPSVVFFRYGYMALILKFKSFNLVSQIRKQRKERKGKYISVVTIARLASSYSSGDG